MDTIWYPPFFCSAVTNTSNRKSSATLGKGDRSIFQTILDTQAGSSSTNIGPSEGAGGAGTKFIYTESSATSQSYGVGIAKGDINYLESTGSLDASVYSFTLTYYFNMSGKGSGKGGRSFFVYSG